LQLHQTPSRTCKSQP